MTRVISAASCYDHARKQKEKRVPWGGVRMLLRCEAGKETSGSEIRGGEEQEMWDGGGMWVRSDVTSGLNRRWAWRPDTGDAEDGKTTLDAFGRGARASDAGLIFANGYHWPSMRKEIRQYMGNFHICQRSRTTRHAPFGILRPLSGPYRPWQDISIDFVIGLSWSNGNDVIRVVVDRLTKMRHLVPCHTTINAPSLADLFLNNIWKHNGLPQTIISDRGPQFASEFWGTICRRLKIDRRLSTAFHPETDGQTEGVNGIMEQYLGSYVNYRQDDWCQWLPIAEFMGNNHASETTGTSPIFAN